MEHAVRFRPHQNDLRVLKRLFPEGLLVEDGRLGPGLPAPVVRPSRRNGAFESEFLEESQLETGVHVAQMQAVGRPCQFPSVDGIVGDLGPQRGVEAVRVELRVFLARGVQRVHRVQRTLPRLGQQYRKGVIDGRKVLANQLKPIHGVSIRQVIGLFSGFQFDFQT